MKALCRGSVLAMALLSGACALTATMVPVEGPMSQSRPVPVIQARADGILGGAGNLTFVLPGGDKCKGRWASAGGANVSVGGATLLSQYGATYVSGYSVSSGGKQVPGHALAVCGGGKVFDLDFVTGEGTGHGFGIAKDNESNIYRFVF